MKEWIKEQAEGMAILLTICGVLGAADWIYCWLLGIN